MKKHFLVTISNDANILYGVRFICSFFNDIADNRVTLLHICRRDATDMAGTLGSMWNGPDAAVQGRLTIEARKSIEKAKGLLSRNKMSIDQVITKTCAERYGKVKDILTEGAQGYDAIILGRRASYSLQWMFERPADETARAIIRDNCCTTPLWICPEPVSGRKNVLLCVDGSENGYRAVDHVGYILADQDQHRITLLYATAGGDEKSSEIFSRAEAILTEHGIGPERTNRTTAWGLTIAGAIQSEVDKGGFAAVAVGLHGEKQGLAKNLKLSGSTTEKLIAKIEKASLWCCP